MALNQKQLAALKKQLEKQRIKSGSVQGVEPYNQFELWYDKFLQGFVSGLQKLASKTLTAWEKKGTFEYQDSAVGMFPAFVIEKNLNSYVATYNKLAAKKYSEYGKFHRTKFVGELQAKIGIDVSSLIKDQPIEKAINKAMRENVELIKSIPKDYFDRIETMIRQGIDKRREFYSLKNELEYIDGVTRSRAKLIARDQTSKFNSNLNQIRQEETGMTHYIWRTVGDEAVRESHAEKDGKRFAWNDPPSDTGHPGQDVQCRCIAEPDISSLVKSLNT